MTSEELRKEAEEYADIKVKDRKGYNARWELVKQAYLAGAEPREKQIQIDAEQIRALQKQNGELTDRVKELEAQIEGKENEFQYFSNSFKIKITNLKSQIEKMKRCEICKHYQCGSCNYHSNWVKDCKENGMKLFELKEIKEK